MCFSALVVLVSREVITKMLDAEVFKYLPQAAGTVLQVHSGQLITDEGSKPEILSRIVQTTAALTRLKPVWNDRSISVSSKIQLIRSLVTSIFLYACESILDPHRRAPKKNTSHRNEVLPEDPMHLLQRPCYQQGSLCQDPAGNWTT